MRKSWTVEEKVIAVPSKILESFQFAFHYEQLLALSLYEAN